jgi:hypothetical protein
MSKTAVKYDILKSHHSWIIEINNLDERIFYAYFLMKTAK